MPSSCSRLVQEFLREIAIMKKLSHTNVGHGLVCLPVLVCSLTYHWLGSRL